MTAQLVAVLSLMFGQAPGPDAPVGVILGSPVVAAETPGSTNLVTSRSPSSGEFAWFNSEYLLWWTKGSPLPTPLVTQGSPTGPSPIGALGSAGTTVLYGGSPVGFSPSSGYRLTAGLMLAPDSPLFIEGSWLQMQTQTANFSASSNASGSPVIATPFFIPGVGPGAELASFPNSIAGNILVESTTRLEGWEFNTGWSSGVNGDGQRLAFLVGVRSASLVESLNIQTQYNDITGTAGGANLTFQGTPVTTGSPLSTMDSFYTSNLFYGAQVGAKFSQEWGTLSLSFVGKVALGDNHEVVSINGSSTAMQQNPGSPSATVPGGIYALPSNIGRYSHDMFAVLPEGTLSLGWQVTPWMKASVAYDILYISNVIRPGNTIDGTVNRANVPTDFFYTGGATPARPSFLSFNGSDYWAQGINFGLTFTY